MILSGLAIREQIRRGTIAIEPYEESRLNPNSYNLRLHEKLLVYREEVLDVKKPNAYEAVTIPKEGMILRPGEL